MTLRDEVDHLLCAGLFADIGRERLELMALTSIEPVSYDAGEELYHAGDPADYAYLIVSGTAEILLRVDHGETIVARVGENETVGETSLLCRSRHRLTVRAVEPVSALRIDRDSFERLLAECPDVSVKLLHSLAVKYDSVVGALLEGIGRIGKHGRDHF
jgi:CRP-like cAMP-binding protein